MHLPAMMSSAKETPTARGATLPAEQFMHHQRFVECCTLQGLLTAGIYGLHSSLKEKKRKVYAFQRS